MCTYGKCVQKCNKLSICTVIDSYNTFRRSLNSHGYTQLRELSDSPIVPIRAQSTLQSPLTSVSLDRASRQQSFSSTLPLVGGASTVGVRNFHRDNKSSRGFHRESEKAPLPKLFYVQNPLIWAANKLDFRYLRNKWDPQFSEAEFQRGCRQAISVITTLLSKNMYDALKPLLTKHAMLSLRREVEILWAEEVKRNISLKPEEVQLIIPRKVHFRSLGNKKLCDIDMVFIGLKWIENYARNPQLLFIDIIARFHRNYSDNVEVPEWTVSAFRVRRFNLLPTKGSQ